MLLKPRSSQPSRTPFIAGAVVVAAVVAALGLTQGDSVATALAKPLSAVSYADVSAQAPMDCHRFHSTAPARIYLTPTQAEAQKMERVILAQIAAVRRHDTPAVCQYASTSGSAFATDPTTSLQRLSLLSSAGQLTFSDVKTGPCRHDAYLTVTGSVRGHAIYQAAYMLQTSDADHPVWSVASVDVSLAAPPVPARVRQPIPAEAKS